MTSPIGWIQTFTGRAYSPLYPDPNAVVIEDIAHALSNVCRFGGHVHGGEFYGPFSFFSVAQHACIVSDHVADVTRPDLRLHGLMHDDSEAYTGDIPRPWKKNVFILRDDKMIPYSDLEDENLRAIYEGLWLPWPSDAVREAIKVIDTRVCVTEALQLMNPLHPDWRLTPENGYKPLPGVVIEPWEPRRAEFEFLRRYRECRC